MAIDILRPGAKWRRADDYATLTATWEDQSTIPTDAELIAAYNDWKAKEDARQAIHNTIAAGYHVDPEDFTIGIEDDDRKAWVELLALVNSGQDAGYLIGLSKMKIKDIDGNLHEVSVNRLKRIIFEAGAYYKDLWDQLQEI